jgi:mannose-6-phosphate isomerase-like protein (cupin superfamily)
MKSSSVRGAALIVLVSLGVFGMAPGHTHAQALTAPAFPDSVTVSSGPHSNLFRHVMTRAEVLAALAQVKDSHDLFVKSNAALSLRVSSNTTKTPWKLHADADELWYVYRGSAKVSLAPFSLQLGVTPPGETYQVGEGDMVNVPRHLAYQIMPSSGRFEYVALRRFALRVPGTGPARGAGALQGPPPIVTTKAQIDAWYNAGTAGTAGMPPGVNRIIFDRAKGADWRMGGAPGPWENHDTNEHLSIVNYGTAKAIIDGFITGAHWDNRGVMGTGVVGGSEYTVGPGDLVFVFRNTAHFFDPISNKFGYLLLDLPQSEPFWPKSTIPNGTGPH